LRSGGPTLGADPSGPNSVPESSQCFRRGSVPHCADGKWGVLTAFRLRRAK
jgi:hypothetical protein